MARHNSLNELFTDIANAIRNKTGTTEPIVADDFDTIIANLPASSTVLHARIPQSLNASVKTTVTLGAKPRYLFLYFTDGYLGDNLKAYSHSVYRETQPATYINGNKSQSFGSTGPNILFQITDTGFVLNGYSSNKAYCEYYAII